MFLEQGFRFAKPLSLFIDIFTMPDFPDVHQHNYFFDKINKSVITNSYTSQINMTP